MTRNSLWLRLHTESLITPVSNASHESSSVRLRTTSWLAFRTLARRFRCLALRLGSPRMLSRDKGVFVQRHPNSGEHHQVEFSSSRTYRHEIRQTVVHPFNPGRRMQPDSCDAQRVHWFYGHNSMPHTGLRKFEMRFGLQPDITTSRSSGPITPILRWLLYADHRVAPIRRSCTGSITVIIWWLDYADPEMASLRRSVTLAEHRLRSHSVASRRGRRSGHTNHPRTRSSRMQMPKA
ncbi:hypothetical protein OKW39_002022 [Paraburkholderia sp. MM6662-R1]